MVSDHEHNWAIGAGRVSCARACGLIMVSDREHNWGQLGPGGCHALRACGLPWSPIMNTIGAIGLVGVTRFGACNLP